MINNTLAQALSLAENYLRKFAVGDSFWSDFEVAFGVGFDRAIAEKIRRSLVAGDFRRPIRVVPDQVLGQASGAFAAATDTVYLRESLVASGDIEHIGEVIIEELGHSIDSQVNKVETPGDEGAIFRLLVKGVKLTAAMLAELRAEDDWAVISIDGQQLAVEMAVFPGTPGNDKLGGVDPNDNIGDDTFTPETGIDTVAGGDGTDTLIIDYSTNTNNGIAYNQYDLAAGQGLFFANGSGQVQYTGIEKFNITGTKVSDDIRGGNSNDTLIGGDGDDRLNGFVGVDIFNGGAGNDTATINLSASTANNLVDIIASTTNYGTQLISIEGLNVTGGSGNDTLVAGGLADNLAGGAGDDVLNAGNGGVDTVAGGDGTDTLIIDYSTNTINGIFNTNGISYNEYDLAAGNGLFFANGSGIVQYTGIEKFNITGTKTNDDIRGGNSNDTLIGGDGDDRLSGFAGVDIFDGGAGNDTATINLSASTANNLVDIIASTTNYGTKLISIEGLNATGGSGNDTLVAGGLSDNLAGGAGDDVLNAGNGGIDTVAGGDGTDTLIVDYSASATGNGTRYNEYDLAAGQAFFFANGAGVVQYTSIEKFNITGTKNNDDIRGGNSNDTLIGGIGSDTLSSGAGNDILTGVNILSTNPGASEIDRLAGGAGRDTFILGKGNVDFYDDGNVATAGLDGYALITDFNPREDTIQLAKARSTYVFADTTIGGTPGTAIYIDKPGTEPDELIAVLQGGGLNSFYGLPQGSIGSNKGQATFTIGGQNFAPTDIISLVDSKGVEKVASKTYWVDDTQTWATFDLTGLTKGKYDVKITNGSSVTNFKQAFTVTDGAVGTVSAKVSTTNTRGDNSFPGVIRLSYNNSGQTDVAAPLFRIKATNATINYGASGTSSSTLQQLQNLVIGTGANGPAGILTAGSTQDTFFTYKPIANGAVSFSVEQVKPSEVIDWAKIKAESRASFSHIDVAAWDTIWNNFTAVVGSTVGQFQAVINRDATHFSQLGLRLDDVGGLFGYEFNRAANSLVDTILTSTTDVFDEAPGLPLQLSRAFYQSTAERYNLGIFGRGWSSGWETHLVKDNQGNILIRFTGNLQSFFKLQSDGTFTDSNDGSKITVVGSEYRLQSVSNGISIFEADGKLKSVIDTNGNQVTLQYTSNLLNKLIHSNGDSLTLTYNPQGRVNRITDSNNNSVNYIYDVTGEHLLSTTDSTGVVTYVYDTSNNANKKHSLLSITSDLGYQSNYEYDSSGHLIKEYGNDPAKSITYNYDTLGSLTVTNGNGVSGTSLLNWDGTIAQLRGANNQNTLFNYDDDGNPILLTTPDRSVIGSSVFGSGGDRFTEIVYDKKNNPIEQADSSGQILKFTYDPIFNKLKNFADARGNGITYSYDSKGNIFKATDAEGNNEQFEVDNLGNITSSVNRRGEKITYQVNKDGQITQRKYADGSQITYAYDTKGNLVSAADATGTTSLEYNEANRFTRIAYSNGRSLQYTYNADGQRTSLITQDGYQTNYSYDAFGRLKSLTDGAGQNIISYDYDAVGRLVKEVNGNGTSSIYTYDSYNQLTSLIHYKSDNAINSSFVYAYNNLGQRISMVIEAGTFFYDYDEIGQLISIITPDNQTIQYKYDQGGNRTTITKNGTDIAYVSNNLDEYTTVGNDIYTYDRDGNLISRNSNGQTSIYSYDAENRLIRVVSPTDTREYQYDALDNRVATTLNGQRTEYLVDPTGLSDIVGEYNSSGLVAHYEYGAGLVRRDNGIVNYYDADGTGSTIGLTSADGAYVNRYSYLPFGEIIEKVEGIANPFKYGGQFGVVDEGNGLNFMRARFYDPVLGRFTSKDPIELVGGDTNFYRYVGNDPVSYVDPTGEKRSFWETVVDIVWGAKDVKDKVDTGRNLYDDANKLTDDPGSYAREKIRENPYGNLVVTTGESSTRLAHRGEGRFDDVGLGNEGKRPDFSDFSSLNKLVGNQLKKVRNKGKRLVKDAPDIAKDFRNWVYPVQPPRIIGRDGYILFQDDYLKNKNKERKKNNDLIKKGKNRPKPNGGGGGKSHADPHLTTFDGTYYDFQGAGEYTFVKSTTDDFEIQTRQESFNGRFATINKAVAIQLGGSKISFDSNTPNTINVDGIATDITDGGFAIGQNIIIRQGTSYFINTSNSDQIQIINNPGYIDLQVSLADNRKGKVVGLLGNFNGSTTDEFALRDGTIIGSTITNAQLYGAYNDSWRITPATSLFNYNPGETTATFTKLTDPTTALNSTTITPAQRTAAEQVARAAGITDPQLLENAILDLFITNNDPTFVQGYQALQKAATANAPNTLINPDSFGEKSWLASGSNIPYNIRFTNNNPSGTTPVAKITITQQLDSNLDLNTFSFSDINFGDTTITIPFGRQSFAKRLDLRSTQGVFVDIDASIDPATSTVTWNFISIDPLTGNPADSNTKGFLAPNDPNGIGQGIVGYTIQPKLGTANDTRINGQANISFNSLAPILTDPVFITLDNDAPTSKVATAIANGTNIDVTWAGTDASSGLAAYDVYVSTDGGEYQIWQNKTTKTSGSYSGESGKTYSFYSVAVDNVDRLEFKAPLAESSVSLGGAVIIPTSYAVTIDKITIPEGNSGSSPVTFTITRSGTINVASSIDYALAGTATNTTDYNIDTIGGGISGTGITGTVNFTANETSKTLKINVSGDVLVEPDETILVTLSNPSVTTQPSSITTATATTTIQNDDAPIPTGISTLRFSKISHLAQNRNELGVFTIDDAQGTVNGILPSQTGYLTEVLKRSQVVFSALGESAVDLQLDNQSSRYLDLPAGKQLGYYLVQNGSTSDLTAGAQPPVFFAFSGNDSGLANAKFTQNGTVSQLAFEDTPGGDKDFNDLVVQIENATTPAPLGTAQQGSKNIFDLTSVVNTTSVQTSFEVKRDASFNNHVGFYKIEDAQGSILVGTALIKPGEAGYRQAIGQGRIAGIDLVGTNGQTTTSNGSFQGGALYAPFLIANASAANADFSNIYTAYSLGNADKVEHIRLLGDNTFGFEDLFGGGDRDYNDVIIKATFAASPGAIGQGT
jgi:RHS repeat-associated protein